LVWPFSEIAKHELVVPKSIPITFAIVYSSFKKQIMEYSGGRFALSG
jgi:hypothetical protein